NCVNWVFGHIVATRQFVLDLAGARPWWDEERHRTYSAGDDGAWSPERAMPLQALLVDYDRSQELLADALPRLTPDALAAPALLGTVGETLAFLQFHEGYHAGQLGILRRLLGKPGVIRPPNVRRPG
ncbi:MAG TPA: DinB family protein, partial [Longimicrobiales bacterium]